VNLQVLQQLFDFFYLQIQIEFVSAAPVGLNGRLSSSFTFFIFDLRKLDVPQIKSQNMCHALMNLLKITLFEKYVDP
jgi:hypothetical protein